MWVIVALFLLPDAYKVGSVQLIYKDKNTCEFERTQLLDRLETTAPSGGKVFVKCADMSGSLRA